MAVPVLAVAVPVLLRMRVVVPVLVRMRLALIVIVGMRVLVVQGHPRSVNFACLTGKSVRPVAGVEEEVVDGGGEASVWLAEPGSVAQERALAGQMAAAVAADYGRVIDEASAGLGDRVARRRILARLRRELRRIGARDYFPGPMAERARAAVEALGDALEAAS